MQKLKNLLRKLTSFDCHNLGKLQKIHGPGFYRVCRFRLSHSAYQPLTSPISNSLPLTPKFQFLFFRLA